jgi:hypothetical protein
MGTWLEHKGNQAHGHYIWATPNSKSKNPKIHVLVLIVLDFQSQILLCSDKKKCLNLGVEEDFWNHNLSGEKWRNHQKNEKRVIKRFGK